MSHYVAQVDGYVRKARKKWVCVCAHPFQRYAVIGRYQHPEYPDFNGESTSYVWTMEEAEERAERMRKSGPFVGRLGHVRYDVVTVVSVANSNYRVDCDVDIVPGDLYFEYKGWTHDFESGHHYCATCALVVWNVDVERKDKDRTAND
jgi:hypothetical protein